MLIQKRSYIALKAKKGLACCNDLWDRFEMVKLVGDGELSAPSLLPENVLPQWQQKIAQMRKKYLRPQIFNDSVEAYFLHEVQFSAAIEAAHFPAVETGH